MINSPGPKVNGFRSPPSKGTSIAFGDCLGGAGRERCWSTLDLSLGEESRTLEKSPAIRPRTLENPFGDGSRAMAGTFEVGSRDPALLSLETSAGGPSFCIWLLWLLLLLPLLVASLVSFFSLLVMSLPLLSAVSSPSLGSSAGGGGGGGMSLSMAWASYISYSSYVLDNLTTSGPRKALEALAPTVLQAHSCATASESSMRTGGQALAGLMSTSPAALLLVENAETEGRHASWTSFSKNPSTGTLFH
mmetsp:Transcript_53571/g.117291  ORF Transcript_53571/g.117291 Transcript_53571/m.117291 type:complete len:248 (+) Transcript_53571:351-1094(+)